MSASENVQKALDSSNEVEIMVTGRKTGRKHSTQVWFVRNEKTVYLLPGGGRKSNWYRNAMKAKRIGIRSGKISLDLTPKPVLDSKQVASIV
ncbi:MAG TPA: nitroreductase/quinone reductase family protein, partial [Candidatus Binatus sp.]|nr:nitroreductase/quinone reductase family protein [Candidatus Binatus sp.]